MKRASVLIIEDDPDSAEAIVAMLGALGCQTSVARNRDAAALQLQCCQADAVLMDYMMPGMSAGTFVGYTRANFPSVKIMLMSASINPKDLASVLGVDAYCAKPLDWERVTAFLFEPPEKADAAQTAGSGC